MVHLLWGHAALILGPQLQVDITIGFAIDFCAGKWCHTFFSFNCLQVSKRPPLWGAMGPLLLGPKLQVDVTIGLTIKFCAEKLCHTLF